MVCWSIAEAKVEVECVHPSQLILVGSSQWVYGLLTRGVDGHGSYDLPLSSVPSLGNQPYFKGQPTGLKTLCLEMSSSHQ